MELSDGEEEDDSNWCTPGGIGRSASSPFPRVGVADRTNSGDSGMESRPDSSGGVGGLGVGSLGERSRGQSAAGSNGTGEKVGESHSERETLINGGTVHMYSLYVVCVVCVIVHIVHVHMYVHLHHTHIIIRIYCTTLYIVQTVAGECQQSPVIHLVAKYSCTDTQCNNMGPLTIELVQLQCLVSYVKQFNNHFVV